MVLRAIKYSSDFVMTR